MHGTLHKINSVQLGAASTMPPSYIRVRAVVWAYGRGQTDTQTRMTTIHFVPSTTHAKCNQQHAHTPRKLRFALCCHSNATRAAIVNPPNSAQLGGSLHHAPKLHPGPCSSVGVRPRTDRQTHRCAWPQYILHHLWLMQNVIKHSYTIQALQTISCNNSKHYIKWPVMFTSTF